MSEADEPGEIEMASIELQSYGIAGGYCLALNLGYVIVFLRLDSWLLRVGTTLWI